MKHTLLIFTTILTLFAFPAFAAGEKIEIKILGMVCDFCAQTMEKVFTKTGHVETLEISLKDSLVTLNMKEGQTFTDEEITKHITDSGYKIENIQRMPKDNHE